MTIDFHRAKRGFEIDIDPSSFVQILTGTSAPNLQADAQNAPVGSIWLVNAGTSITTAVYQKFQDFTNTSADWRNITGTGGSATEEGDIRTFIGKDAVGVETPDYASPTGGGPLTVGNIIGTNDNLELATAKLNAFVYQNNAEIKGTSVVTISDTLPVGINMARWVVRINSNGIPSRVRAREIFAIRDDANGVDFTSSNLLTRGGAITGLSFSVTSVGTQLILTVTAGVAFDYEIKRLAAIGP
jgi:hypothetical protein